MRAASALAGRAAIVAALLLGGATPAYAHRLDEYLQAATIAVARDRVAVQLRLAPGVAVAPALLARIDADGNGLLSAAEQRAYAERVRRELSLAVDGDPLRLRLVSARFATTDAMRAGRGEILLAFDAPAPGGGADRTLAFENRHERRLAAYLVNALVPADAGVRVVAQRRDFQQSRYEMDYAQAGGAAGVRGWLGAALLLPLAGLALLVQQRGRASRPG